MTSKVKSSLLNTPSIAGKSKQVSGSYCSIKGKPFYRIDNCQQMPEFFVSVVSAFDHWMFVTCRGAISTGRKNSRSSLFPYYSADKIMDCAHTIGPTTIMRIKPVESELTSTPTEWIPFSRNPNLQQDTSQVFYKSVLGDEVLFEETNHSLGVCFRYGWKFSEEFGFVRECFLQNESDKALEVELLDGLENILPSSMDPSIQLRFSNLGDAYKKNELLEESKIGVFYLSSIPSDLAMPNEGLRANVVWSGGLEGATTLLSSRQIQNFRQGRGVIPESSVRGTRGAYLRCKTIQLARGDTEKWQIIAELNFDQTDLVRLVQQKKHSDLMAEVENDTAKCHEELEKLIASSDGIQVGAKSIQTNRHLSNVLFNIMRGGIPINGYVFKSSDFVKHCENSNRETYERHKTFLNSLPDELQTTELNDRIMELDDSNLVRICVEFLPLTFSRRHGDPTRPWNEFSIEVADKDGERKINYQGNWRDIFQNWEALSVSYPELVSSMVFRFLNASTADGYNPYRITNEGVDWEKQEPDDPWSNIGYWGDHQIVYLLRLLIKARQFSPEKLNQWLSNKCFAFANVPYRIKEFQQILATPRDTIEFDGQLDTEIERRVEQIGSDGKLLQDDEQSIAHVTMLEKLLIPALVKMSNLIPEGGIWLNTQRPEWNDANNAIVGSGLSVVTT
jgi:hypothetical protein